MGNQDKLKEIAKKLSSCRKELEQIRGDMILEDYQKVRASISSSISFLNRAGKQIDELSPMEGQISLFDYLDETDDFDMEK